MTNGNPSMTMTSKIFIKKGQSMPNFQLIYDNEKHAYVVWNQAMHGEFQVTFYDEETAMEFMVKFLSKHFDEANIGKKG